MFRKTLLATTALVLGASVAYAGTVHHGMMPGSKNHPKFLNLGVPGHMVGHGLVPLALGTGHTSTKPVHNNILKPHKGSNFSKEANAQWISWYGYIADSESECSYISSNYHYCDTEQANNAVAVTGVKSATSLSIPLFSLTGSTTTYEAGIYSSVSGLPGNALATGTITGASDNEYCCTNSRTATLSGQSSFSGKKTYFVELSCATGQSDCDGGWDMEDVDFTGATVDYFHSKYHYSTVIGSSVYNSSGSSPWHESTYYPTSGAYAIN
ncbi:MAG TPA: hypothetical protein VHX61_05275 [Rhizomicrobium sp.]|jgi:hypothetical protein|nr:hypothetical protein [Rhizomicrobium sp.]